MHAEHANPRIESKLGIVAMLNEECVRPKGSNEFLGQMSDMVTSALVVSRFSIFLRRPQADVAPPG